MKDELHGEALAAFEQGEQERAARRAQSAEKPKRQPAKTAVEAAEEVAAQQPPPPVQVDDPTRLDQTGYYEARALVDAKEAANIDEAYLILAMRKDPDLAVKKAEEHLIAVRSAQLVKLQKEQDREKRRQAHCKLCQAADHARSFADENRAHAKQLRVDYLNGSHGPQHPLPNALIVGAQAIVLAEAVQPILDDAAKHAAEKAEQFGKEHSL